MPVILGEKSPGERFPGAVSTYTLEAMMQDRKALQAGTSHYLGQNFAKGSNISFCNKDGEDGVCLHNILGDDDADDRRHDHVPRR